VIKTNQCLRKGSFTNPVEKIRRRSRRIKSLDLSKNQEK